MRAAPAPRLKTFWFKDQRERDPAQIASASAAVVWRTANHRIENLRRGGFVVDAGADYANVLVEVLCLMAVAADRIAFRSEPGAWRVAFTSALVRRLGELLAESLDELIGPDPDPSRGWSRRFVDRYNLRAQEYADHAYAADGPSFGFLRCFGERLVESMSDADDRRWAHDQAMTVEGPEAIDTLEKSMRGLLGLAPKPPRRGAMGD